MTGPGYSKLAVSICDQGRMLVLLFLGSGSSASLGEFVSGSWRFVCLFPNLFFRSLADITYHTTYMYVCIHLCDNSCYIVNSHESGSKSFSP
jgi:hypothetical protein